MVRFKDLNFGLGLLLYNIESEEEYTDYKFLLKSLKPDVIIESIKDGYFSKVSDELKNDSDVKKAFFTKLEKLDMSRIKKRDVAGDSMFDYQGKIVSIEFKEIEMWGTSRCNAKVVSVDFDEQKNEFKLVIDTGYNVGGKLFRRNGFYESNINSIEVIV